MYPVLLQTESITIYSYSIMMSLAFLTGSLIFILGGRRNGIATTTLFKLVLIAQFSALAGARLLFVINNFSLFQNDIMMAFAPVPGGFAMNGGLIFVVIAASFYLRHKNISFFKIADEIVLPLAILIIILKVGCLLGGCCYGTETNFWGINYSVSSPAFNTLGPSHTLHAVPLYEAGSVFLILAVLKLLHSRVSFQGRTLLLFIILYCFARITSDFFRGDVDHNYFTGLTQTQVISIFAMISIALLYILKLKQHISQNAASAIKEKTISSY